jgi:AcrR family transcriptional regulator
LPDKQQAVKSAGNGARVEERDMNHADPRVKRTRKLILEAFESLLPEKGFHAVSVQDIAARATVNRATFYAHFIDKYDLLDQLVGEWFREVLNRRQLSATAFTFDNLHRLIVTVLEATADFQGHCQPSRHHLDSSIEARIQRELNEFLRDWLVEVLPAERRDRVSAETAASVLSWAIFGAAIDWSRNSTTVVVDERARQIVMLLTQGLTQVAAVPGAPRASANGVTAREARSGGES